MLVPAGTLVLGAMLTRFADARRDRRTAERERDAAARVDAREQRAFKRNTLIELQDAVMRLGGGTRAMWSAAYLTYIDTGVWNVYMSPEGSAKQREAYLAVRRLTARTLDDAVRGRAGPSPSCRCGW
jgi:hypothetical protein